MNELSEFLIHLGATMIALGVFVLCVLSGAWCCVKLLNLFMGDK